MPRANRTPRRCRRKANCSSGHRRRSCSNTGSAFRRGRRSAVHMANTVHRNPRPVPIRSALRLDRSAPDTPGWCRPGLRNRYRCRTLHHRDKPGRRCHRNRCPSRNRCVPSRCTLPVDIPRSHKPGSRNRCRCRIPRHRDKPDNCRRNRHPSRNRCVPSRCTSEADKPRLRTPGSRSRRRKGTRIRMHTARRFRHRNPGPFHCRFAAGQNNLDSSGAQAGRSGSRQAARNRADPHHNLGRDRRSVGRWHRPRCPAECCSRRRSRPRCRHHQDRKRAGRPSNHKLRKGARSPEFSNSSYLNSFHGTRAIRMNRAAAHHVGTGFAVRGDSPADLHDSESPVPHKATCQPVIVIDIR
jgi:hypothetical protein